MKLKTIFATLSLAAITSVMANPQPVQVVWPFAAGSSQAMMIRGLLDSANQQQNKYQFTFVNKPGAGGAIAANYVADSPQLAVLASTSSFYTRPLLYTESHDPQQFRLVSVTCANGPVALFSRKYKSFDELKGRETTVGIIPGSITQLFTQLLAKSNPEFKFLEVPYKGTPEATTDMLARHIDANVELLGTASLARLTPDASVLGISGGKTVADLPYTRIRGMDNLTNSYYMFVPNKVNSNIAKELSIIFNGASNVVVKDGCDNERGLIKLVPFEQTEKLHQSNFQQWKQITEGIPKQ
jgi:tripartite-type tricarboxylate transporter receptor subunit TctC